MKELDAEVYKVVIEKPDVLTLEDLRALRKMQRAGKELPEWARVMACDYILLKKRSLAMHERNGNAMLSGICRDCLKEANIIVRLMGVRL